MPLSQAELEKLRLPDVEDAQERPLGGHLCRFGGLLLLEVRRSESKESIADLLFGREKNLSFSKHDGGTSTR